MAEGYTSGCVRYTSGRTDRCLCDSASLSNALAPQAVEEVVASLRIAPQTMHDVESVSVNHHDMGGGLPYQDLPKSVRLWLSALDGALRSLIGAGYKPFFINP